tara:strand:+ start:508 stop:669 length:162 start_codon:yes stop_codon:yes gene_type:complete
MGIHRQSFINMERLKSLFFANLSQNNPLAQPGPQYLEKLSKVYSAFGGIADRQ